MLTKKATAIIIVDVQNDFFSDEKMSHDKNRLAGKVNELTQMGRLSGVPIIWVRQEFKKDLSDAYVGVIRNNIRITIEGEYGSELLPELRIDKSDIKIVKKRYSAFFGTDLRKLLDEKGVRRLIVAGVKTYSCVRMTAIDAYQMDYDVIIASDCLAKVGDLHDDITIKFLSKHIATVMTNNGIFKLISTGDK
jgi:maleamate amidohydrolase